MNNENYQNELLVLALATGFRGYVKDGKSWIMTIFKGQSMPFKIDFSKDDIFCGNEKIILNIIDTRLGIKDAGENLTTRTNALTSAFGDENHKFWDIAKQNIKKGE